MAHTRLTDLPDEILRCICFLIDWNDALVLQATCRRFVDIADEHLLWKQYCRTSFKHWSARHQIATKLGDYNFLEWKRLFMKHHEADLKTRSALQDIISSQTARIPKIEAIVSLGYDSKDALLQSHERAVDLDDHLARRYWSRVALSCLHKSLAVKEWAALKSGDQNDNSFERSVGAFDLFVLDNAPEGDISDIFQRLDEYVDGLRDANPAIDDQSPQQKASTVARFLISNNLIGMPGHREYHNIEHNFLGRSLFTQEKKSLPIITVVIYCYVLRQLGLRAAPCGFPLHVHAIVHPPPGIDLQGYALPPDTTDEPTLYMDPVRSSTPTLISSLHEQLHFLASQLPSADHAAFLSASTPRDITTRCARNILNSLQHGTERPTGPPIDQHSAQYAALWALVLLPTSTLTLRHQLHMLIDLVAEKYPHDIALVEKHILPLIARSRPQHAQTCRTVRAADQNAPSTVKRRGDTHQEACDSIKFRVGQVFKHRRYGYTAVVTGWDAKCDAGEEWIRRMNVDRLDGGRTQAFYHAFVKDDNSIRYVAEENIELLDRDEVEHHTFSLEIGRWFKRWDKVGGVFISNIRDEYPED